MQRYLASALSPAKVSEVHLNEEERRATVIVPESQLSLAIGKEGQNVRLAARLTGWRIDICSEEQLRAQVHAARAEEMAAKLAAAPTTAQGELEATEQEVTAGEGEPAVAHPEGALQSATESEPGQPDTEHHTEAEEMPLAPAAESAVPSAPEPSAAPEPGESAQAASATKPDETPESEPTGEEQP